MTQGGRGGRGQEEKQRRGREQEGGDNLKKNAKKMTLPPSAPLLALLLIATGAIFGGTHSVVVSRDNAWALTKIWASFGALQGEIQKLFLKAGFQKHGWLSKTI